HPTEVDHRADIYSLGVVFYQMLTGELPLGRFAPPSKRVQVDVRLDEVVLRALEKEPELRYQQASEIKTQVETIATTPRPGGQARGGSASPSATGSASAVTAGLASTTGQPRVIRVGNCRAITPERLATFDGQFLHGFGSGQLILDERQLTLSDNLTSTVIPLAAIRDLSIGHYPVVMNPAGVDFISVTYDEKGQSRRLFIGPYKGFFGWRAEVNRLVSDWFRAIHDAATAATGRTPNSTPAYQLDVPGSHWGLVLAFAAVVLLPLLPLLPHLSGAAAGGFLYMMVAFQLAFIVLLAAFFALRVRARDKKDIAQPSSATGSASAVTSPWIAQAFASLWTVLFVLLALFANDEWYFRLMKEDWQYFVALGLIGAGIIGYVRMMAGMFARTEGFGLWMGATAATSLATFVIALPFGGTHETPWLPKTVALILAGITFVMLVRDAVRNSPSTASPSATGSASVVPAARRTDWRAWVMGVGVRDGRKVINWPVLLVQWFLLFAVLCGIWIANNPLGSYASIVLGFPFLSAIFVVFIAWVQSSRSVEQLPSLDNTGPVWTIAARLLFGGLLLAHAIPWWFGSRDIAAIRLRAPWSENLFRPDKVGALAIGLGLISLIVAVFLVKKRNLVRTIVSLVVVGLVLLVAVMFSQMLAVRKVFLGFDQAAPSATGSASAVPAAPATVVDVAQKPGGPWIAPLDVGEIELVAVSRHPSKGEPWWRPDGSPYTEKPFDMSGGRYTVNDPTVRHYEFVFRLPVGASIESRGSSEPRGMGGVAGLPLGADSRGSWGGSGTLSSDGRSGTEYQYQFAAFPESADTVEFYMAVATAPWTIVATHGPTGSSTVSGFRVDDVDWTVSFGPAVETADGNAVIAVSHDDVFRDTRVVAIDIEGKEHSPCKSEGLGLGNVRQLTFQKLPLSRVKEFQLQSRPYRVVEFRNVALRPKPAAETAEPSATGSASAVPATELLQQGGWQLWWAGRPDMAVRNFEQSIKLDPNSADAWNGLGWAALNSGNSTRAKEAFEKAVALDPNHPGALNGLGQLHLARREYDLAEPFLLKAAPEAPAAWWGLARLYLLQGKFDQAEKWAGQIVELDQGDESSNDYARRMLEAAKKKELGEALRMIVQPPLLDVKGDAADAARIKLQAAEQLLKTTKARHDIGHATIDEVLEAMLARDLAEAEVRGDTAAASRIKLQAAEELLKTTEARHDIGHATIDEVFEARLARDLAAAEVKGDTAAASRIKLQAAEELLKIVEERHKSGTATLDEVVKARLARDLAAAEVKTNTAKAAPKTTDAEPSDPASTDAKPTPDEATPDEAKSSDAPPPTEDHAGGKPATKADAKTEPTPESGSGDTPEDNPAR
ncbi:MAG: tetratricopeptide repeat protein, partial [Pirellulaceae bacterium]|nr:tetratricopeptide repeat protein [Pirellulaceae bacterium]